MTAATVLIDGVFYSVSFLLNTIGKEAAEEGCPAIQQYFSQQANALDEFALYLM